MMDCSHAHEIKFFGNCSPNLPRELDRPPSATAGTSLATYRVIYNYFIITNNYLDSTTNQIYVVNLHGNTKKKEVAPDGSKDENVFDIQQGVSVCFFNQNIRRLA